MNIGFAIELVQLLLIKFLRSDYLKIKERLLMVFETK